MAQRVVDSDSKIQAELCCVADQTVKRGLAIPNFGQQYHHKKCEFLVMDSDARIHYTQFSQCYMPDNNSKELMRGENTLREVRAIKRLVPHQKVGRRIPIHRNGHWNDWTISDNGRTITRN